MGVSVSYKGVGGQRNFDLTGLPTGDAELLLGSRKKKFVPENFRRALTPQPIDPTAEKEKGLVKLNESDMRPAPLDKKMMPGGAVVASPTGLCLEGEQQNPVVLGDKIYGSRGGRKGYYSVDEMDPPTPAAERVGPLGVGGNGADDSVGKIGSPFAYQVAGRLNIEKNDNGDTVLVEYDKDVKTTALGRTSGVTGERRRVVGIFPSPEIRPPHPYEVRWASPVDVTEEEVEVPTLGAEHWQETENEGDGEGEGEGDSLEYPTTKTRKNTAITPKEGFWMIWLPSDKLFYFYGWWIDVRKRLEPAEGYPDGWYKLETLPKDEDGALYLCSKRYPKNEKEPEVVFASDPSEMTDLDFFIRICNTVVNKEQNIHRVKQFVTSTVVATHSQGGSALEIGENDIVAISLDYVTSESDKDWAYHKYALRLKRGRLKIEDGLLSVEEDSDLTLFVDTVPLSDELKIPSADYGSPQE